MWITFCPQNMGSSNSTETNKAQRGGPPSPEEEAEHLQAIKEYPSECPMHQNKNAAPPSECPMHNKDGKQSDIDPLNMVKYDIYYHDVFFE